MSGAIRTLIVNCEPERAQMLRQVLSLASPMFRVVAESYSGTEGLALARSMTPDLVVTCITLPGISGLQLTTTVKKDHPNTKVVIGTVRGDMRQQAVAAGADAFVAYPAGLEELAAVVCGAVGIVPKPSPLPVPRSEPLLPQASPLPNEPTASPEGAKSLRRVLDILANPAVALGAYFALAILCALFGLDRSPIAGPLFGGTCGVLFVVYFLAYILRRPLLSEEEKDAEDQYHDSLGGQRGP